MDCYTDIDVKRCSVLANHLWINRNIFSHPGNTGKEQDFQGREFTQRIGKENIECDIRLAYDTKTAYDMAKKVIRQRLEEQTDIMQEKLDKLMDF